MEFLNTLRSEIKILILVILVSLSVTNGETLFKLECNNNILNSQEKLCTLSSKQDGLIEYKVQHMMCVESDCKESLVFSSDNNLFACQHTTNKKSGDCQKVLLRNVQPFQSALVEMYQALGEQQKLNSAEQLNSDSEPSNPLMRLLESKRGLPFEALNYGRKKRQLPFEALNYGKRSFGCDCSNDNNNNKRSLPFETILYGKRALPFEALNYGKRAYIPIDGYIMGKRQE